MDIRKLQRAIVDGLEDVKGQNIAVFNTEHLSPLFERVIIASGTSNRQTKALAASVRDAVKASGHGVLRIEGEANGEWIIVDCGAAVVHLMQPTIREYYHLEEIWGDKPVKMKIDNAPRRLVKASPVDGEDDEDADAPRAARAPRARKAAADRRRPGRPRRRRRPAKKPSAAKKAAPARKTASAKTSAPARKTAAAKTPARKTGPAQLTRRRRRRARRCAAQRAGAHHQDRRTERAQDGCAQDPRASAPASPGPPASSAAPAAKTAARPAAKKAARRT